MKVEIAMQLLAHAVAPPSYATQGAAGADLTAAIPEDKPIKLKAGERTLAPTGLSMSLPLGWEAQVRPRSGLALEKGVTVLNAPGTIDSDYRGEIKVLLVNLGKEAVEIQRGDRIAQLVVAPAPQARFQQVEMLLESVRGEGGFGSTGR